MAVKNKKSQDTMNVSNYQKKIEELKLQSQEKELFIKTLEDELFESKEIINNQKKKIDEIEEKSKNYFSNDNQNFDLKNKYNDMKRENDEMKAKVKKLQSERDIMKKTNDKLMKQIKSDLKGDKFEEAFLDKISKENQELQNKLSQFESQCAEKDFTIKNLNKKIRQYEIDLADTNLNKKGNSGLSKQEKENYENKIRDLEVELGKAEGQLGSLEGTIMMHEEENITLKEENASIKKQLDILKASKELKGNMGSLKKRVAKLEHQLEQANKTNQEAQNTIKMLKKKSSETNIKEKSVSATNNEEVLNLKEKIALLELDLEVATLGAKEKDAAIEKQEQMKKDYQKKINELQKKVNEGKMLEEKLIETSDKLLRAENELNILKDSSFEANESTKKYRVEQETSNKEIKKYKDLSKSLNDELDKIKKESNDLKQQISDLEKEKLSYDVKMKDFSNLENENSNQGKEIEKLKEKIKQSNKELDKKKAKIKQLTSDLEDAKVKETQLESDFEVLMKKIEDSQKESMDSANKIIELTKEISEAKAQISQYEKELKEAHQTIKSLEKELKETKDKWTDSIRSREVALETSNSGDFEKLKEENKKLYDDLTKEQNTLKEYQKREQDLINEAKIFEEKLEKISIELNEKSILSSDLLDQVKQLEKEKEISQKKIIEDENKLVSIQQQLDDAVRERDEKLVQYKQLEKELEENKQLLGQSERSTSEQKDKELALANEQIRDLKEKTKDYNEKVEELEKLRLTLKDYNSTIEELRTLKKSVWDYNVKVEELDKLKTTLRDYNQKVEELNKLRATVKDYDEKVEELNKLREMTKNYNEKMEALNRSTSDQEELESMRAMIDELENQVKEFNDTSVALEERDKYIKELETTIKKLEISVEERSREVEGGDRDKEIEELKGKCAELEITTLEDQLKIKELEDNLHIQQTEFESLESSWDDLKCYVGELEKEIETSHASLNEKKKQLATLESQVESMKKELENNKLVKESVQSREINDDNSVNVNISSADMDKLQPFIQKAKSKDKSKSEKQLSQLILLALTNQEKEINNLKLKLDQNILKFNSQNKRNSVTENDKDKLKKLTQDAECLREQNLQLAKELAETKSQYKAREIEVEKVTDSLFNQISTLENEFITLEEDKNSILYDFKQYKYTVHQEMKQLVEKHSTEEEKKQMELEALEREHDRSVNNGKDIAHRDNEIIGDTYKVFIDKLDESLTKKDREIVDMNITMNESKREIDEYKTKLMELEKAHHQLLQQGDNNNRGINNADNSLIIKEKMVQIKNLETLLNDAKDKLKIYETSQVSLEEQNEQLSQELQKVKEEAKKLAIAVEDAKRSENVKVITKEITATDPATSEEIYVYQQKLKAANEEIQELLVTINEQKEIIEKMTKELNQLRSELEKTTSESLNNQEILKNQIISLNQKLTDAKLENQNQKRTISELEQAAARISASNINAAAAGEQFPMDGQTIQQLKSKIEFLQNRIESLQNERKTEEEASKNNIETAKARIAAMENLMIAYRNKIAESNKRALAAETQIQEQNQEIDRLYNEIDIAHSQLQEIERQVGRAMPSSAIRKQRADEGLNEEQLQYIDYANEEINQTQNYPTNEETLIVKSNRVEKTAPANNVSAVVQKSSNDKNSVDIMDDDANVMIMKNNQLESDSLIRDCMNIFSSLDDMSLNFTPDFMIEKDGDLENSILNGSIIIDHPSYDGKYGVISSSKDQIKLNESQEMPTEVKNEEGNIFLFLFYFVKYNL